MNRLWLLLTIIAAWLGAGGSAQAITTVVIDAGHGGHDRGGVMGQKIAEKPYTLDVAKRLEKNLRRAGFRTIMTRSSDVFVGLRERSAIANSQRDALFMCIHFNSAPREGASGIETYYYGRNGAPFAAAVHREVTRISGTPDRGIRTRGYYVLRNTSIPAVLAELGFLTNREEGNRIAGSSSYRQKLADALTRAIVSQRSIPGNARSVSDVERPPKKSVSSKSKPKSKSGKSSSGKSSSSKKKKRK